MNMQIFICGKRHPGIKIQLEIRAETLEKFKTQTKHAGISPKELMEQVLNSHEFQPQQSATAEGK